MDDGDSVNYFKKIKDFDVSDHKLGQGVFGEVYLARLSDSPSEICAVKILTKANEKKDHLMTREVDILMSIKGPHIVDVKKVYESKTKIYIFMKYCNEGDLEGFLKKKENYLSELEGINFIRQLLKAMRILYEKGVFHRDLKPENILIHNGELYLSDFGAGKIIVPELMEEMQNHTLNKGTPLYESLEMLEGREYSSKNDVWSAGIIFFQILYGNHPFVDLSLVKTVIKYKSQYLKILKEKELVIPGVPYRSPWIKEMLISMLQIDQKSRWSWPEVFLHFDRSTKELSNDIFISFETSSKSTDYDFEQNVRPYVVWLREFFLYKRDISLFYFKTILKLGDLKSKGLFLMENFDYQRFVYSVSHEYVEFSDKILKDITQPNPSPEIKCNEVIWKYFLDSEEANIIKKKLFEAKKNAENILANQKSNLIKIIEKGLDSETNETVLQDLFEYLGILSDPNANLKKLELISSQIWTDCLKKSKLQSGKIGDPALFVLYQTHLCRKLKTIYPQFLELGRILPNINKFSETIMSSSRELIFKELFANC